MILCFLSFCGFGVRRHFVFLGRCIFDRDVFRRSYFLHEIQLHPSRHLISRLRRQLLLKAKPVCVALQRFRNPIGGGISPFLGLAFHSFLRDRAV